MLKRCYLRGFRRFRFFPAPSASTNLKMNIELGQILRIEYSEISSNNTPHSPRRKHPSTMTSSSSSPSPEGKCIKAKIFDNSFAQDSGLESEEEMHSHTCSNLDAQSLSACEYCRLLNSLAVLCRTFTNRNDIDAVILLEECITSVEGCRLFMDKLTPHLHRFDFSPEVQQNGYRTFVLLSKITVTKCLYVVDDVNHLGASFSENTHRILHEKFVDWTRILRLIHVCLHCLYDFAISASATSPCLFTSNREALDKLLSFSKERANVVGFHGRLLGYQFTKSVRGPIRLLGCMMAAFSHIYNTDSIFRHTIVSPPDFVNYWRKPKTRAERIAEVVEQDPLDFFTNFWRVQEKGILRIISNCLGDPVETNLELSIPPTKLQIETSTEKGTITILPPTEYLGPQPVMVRLVSHKVRHGAVGSKSSKSPIKRIYGSKVEGMSKNLIIHCHGGGFVAQSSNSHLVYLKHWARGLGVPILSVDYSLAPEAPYPRAIHEAFYAYVWALKNAHLLGSTAERVVVVGDSAGGLLLTGVILLCIELGIRIPDGALLVYTPQLMEPAITPARLLSLADPLIPYPALAACMGAYLGKTFDPSQAKIPSSFVDGGWEPSEEMLLDNSVKKFETLELEELEGVTVPKGDFHLSPLIAPDSILKKFPTTAIATSNFDPCMDDCIEFAKRLRDLGVPVKLNVESTHIPHGYLNFGKISGECFEGTTTCLERLKELLGTH